MSDDNKIDVRSTDYNRPQHEWACGKAESGNPCPLGPSALGVCRVEKQCEPKKRGGLWTCTRDAMAGGTCDIGPSSTGHCSCDAEKCAPVRSVRAHRGAFAISSVTLMAGLLVFNFSGPWKNNALAPGPLTLAHGQILKGSDRCAACHPAADAKFSNWVTSTFRDDNPYRETQTERCLNCHEKTMVRETATLAHTTDAERIHEISTQHLASANQLEPRAIASHLQSDISCNTCHREHHGDDDLSAMTSKQCQSCHQNQFHSLNDGHPGFANWPYASDRGISFDHEKHLGKYFTQSKKNFSCNDCHVDEEGQVVAVASFDKTCAACHDEFLNQVDILTFLSLPMIDPEAFSKAVLTVGDWPAEAVGDFDGRLPIFVRVLLMADSRGQAAMQRLGHDFDFFDVSLTENSQLEDAARLVVSLKTLIYDLSVDGQATIKRRFESILGRELTTGELQAIAGQLSPAVFRTAQERWFPNLAEEINQQKTNTQLIDPDSTDLGGKESVAFGGWYVDAGDYSIKYRPIGHRDELARSWIELMAELQTKVSGDYDWEAEFNRNALTKQCASCHINSDKRQWKGSSATTIARGFTHFDHGPHLLLPSLADCTSCHGLSWKSGAGSAGVSSASPHHAEFETMDKAACAKCHTADGAGNSCTTCHNYHVNFSSPHTATPDPTVDN